MPAPLPDRQRLKAEIVRRVRAGETLKAVCATPGLPAPRTVYGWTWRDPSFDADLAAAVALGRDLRLKACPDLAARAVLDRPAAGEPLGRIVRDPAMPSAGTIRHWRTSQGWFAAEVWRLLAVHRAARAAALKPTQASRYRPWTEAEGDRVLVRVGRGERIADLHRADPSLPPPWLIARWRRESPDFDRDLQLHIRIGRTGRALRRRRALAEPLCDALIDGASFNSLAGRQGLPSRKTLARWTRRDPALAQDIAAACDERESWLRDQQFELLTDLDSTNVRDVRRKIGKLSRRISALRTRPGVRRGK